MLKHLTVLHFSCTLAWF